jgi:hypothetical protein
MRVRIVKSGLRWNGEVWSGPHVPIGTIIDLPKEEYEALKDNSCFADAFEVVKGRPPNA